MLFVALAQRSRLQPDQPLADKVIAAVSRCGSAPLAFGVIAGGTDGYFRETESPNYRRTNEPASCLTQLHATRDARRLAASRRRAVDRRRRNSRGFGVDCVCGAFAASTSSMRRTQSWLALAAQYVRIHYHYDITVIARRKFDTPTQISPILFLINVHTGPSRTKYLKTSQRRLWKRKTMMTMKTKNHCHILLMIYADMYCSTNKLLLDFSLLYRDLK
ncbi:unnamed protein product [Acanthoscelides obtectus]|uniref:Uncharacterized protein n=1 Tax=Acanthoscelides obtectus TaxID=200917 RepID=A0A9P0KE81_ACAOB|nr:unnamed protein product [Acanthoscelides obtectus]CAK1666930.1 hypothetical protein AOBTE_LOCUS25558 [Acanthoscelides obtectus]